MPATLNIRVSQFITNTTFGFLATIASKSISSKDAPFTGPCAEGRFPISKLVRQFLPVHASQLLQSPHLATAMATNAFAKHVESLADARCVPQKQLENRLLFLGCRFFQPLLRCFAHFVYYPQSSPIGRNRLKYFA
jgi:hypothetical protein